MNKNKTSLLFLSQYLIIFICFLCMFFFIIPQSDVYLFARNTDGSLYSAFEHSLYYGNGRLLGNLIAVFFSSHFEFASVLIAVSMSSLVYAINKLLFKNNPRTLFLVSVLVAFPSAGILKECYYLFASFVNYMLSVVLIAFILLLMKKSCDANKISNASKAFYATIILFLGISSCLFSENTTIVSFVISVCLLIFEIISKRKISVYGVSYLSSTIIGTVVMFMIPKITGTAWKMDHYRSISTTIPQIINSFFGGFVKFSQIFIGFLPAIIPLSIALFVLSLKNSGKFQKIQSTFFCLYPIFSVINQTITLTSLYIPWVNLFQAILTALFIVDSASIIFSIKDKEFRWASLLFSATLASSVAPMMLVNQYGHRTYVITFFISLFFSVYLLKNIFDEKIIEKCKQMVSPKQLSIIFCCILLGLTVFLTSQAVYNFNFFVERTTHIAQEIKSNPTEPIKVPILPNNSTSIEDECTNIIADVISVGTANFDITYFTDCKNSEQYRAILADSLPSQTIKALENIRFKDPLIIEKLVEE